MDNLPETHETWLSTKITEYELIPKDEIVKYTSGQDAQALHEFRAELLRETFQGHRNHFLEYLSPK
jgi:hypothetical protein